MASGGRRFPGSGPVACLPVQIQPCCAQAGCSSCSGGGLSVESSLSARPCFYAGRCHCSPRALPYRPWLFLQQAEAVGVGSLFIVCLTALFVGAVLSLQGLHAFGLFNAEALVGLRWRTLARELAPVFTGLMLTARTGGATATELGTMRVTEQIDALETMAVASRQHLIVPRTLAGLLMAPVLTMIFNVVAMFGAYLVAL